MNATRTITLSGDLGSGKSTVAKLLAEQLGLRYVSMGDIHREMAVARGIDALHMNQHSSRDVATDAYIDGVQRDLAATGEPLIVDSRLGWHFFSNAFKVQLKTDPWLAAARVFERRDAKAEIYESVEETVQKLRERSALERSRFLIAYGVDKDDLHNYDLVCDTSGATAREVADTVAAVYLNPTPGGPLVFVDPSRVDLSTANRDPGASPATVAWQGDRFALVAGRDLVQGARDHGERLLPVRLADVEMRSPVP